jgi:hypothetical protein
MTITDAKEFNRLADFIERVRSGHFYADYDAATESLGNADRALKALRTAAAGASAGAAFWVVYWPDNDEYENKTYLTKDEAGAAADRLRSCRVGQPVPTIRPLYATPIPEPAKAGDAVLLREALDKIEAKIDQLKHYRDDDCQLDHARTIADGRIQQAEMDAGWLRAALSTAQPDTAAQGGKNSDVEALAATTAERPGTVTSEPEPSTSDTAPAEPVSGLYLDRFEVRRILIDQPDENLEITEAILADINALPIHTAAHPPRSVDVEANARR